MLILHLITDLFIKSNSKYGESGTHTTAGGITDSGTNEYTFPATLDKAVANGVRIDDRIVDGIY
ncbi:MAG: hypothetical protein EBS18_01675 [Actinobacteria bacterium]|nr:hypothetical protein [Actinomycetota bacterium]